MLADEVARAQARAVVQAEERNTRHAARSFSQTTSKETSPPSTSEKSHTTLTMEEQQYANIIDSIPTFSGESRDNIHDWLDIISLKFDLLAYDPRQKRRFIPQYLAGNALKWHLAHRDDLGSWNEYIAALASAFPRLTTTSRDMNLKLLRDRKQNDTEAFTEYYTAIIDLCHKHNQQMGDLQIIDWLKAGMNLKLYERLQGEEFATPQALLVRAQRVELDNAVLDARKRECTISTAVTPPATYSPVKHYAPPIYYQPRSPPNYAPSYPAPLMPASYSTSSYDNAPRFRSSLPSQSSAYPYSSYPTTTSSTPPRRAIVCYSCGQPGHISPQCPSRPKD